MNFRRSSIFTALLLAVLLFQFVPNRNIESASAAGLCNAATFISDVTIPDSSVLNSGAVFVKTWRLKNSGTCTWTTAYSAVFDSGDQFGGNTSAPMPVSVAPGQTVDITVNMSAPVAAGHYRSYWKLKDANAVKFGLGTLADKPFWVDIIVSAPPTITLTPGSYGLNLHGTVLLNGVGLSGVNIYRSYASYPLALVAVTGADGAYQVPFAYIPGQENITVKAEKAGYSFDPVQAYWIHYPGIENKTVDFVAAPVDPGPFPGPGAAFDFGYMAGQATWTSGAGALPYPGTDGDARGFVKQTNPTTYENGAVDSIGPNLLVAPQNVYNGYVQGVFPEYTVQTGDRFRTSVGCAYGSSCYVTFRITYRVGGSTYSLWSWAEKNEGLVYNLDRDISALAGKKVTFILSLLATGSPTGDRAIWGRPRIIHTGPIITPSDTPTSTAVVPFPTTGTLTITNTPTVTSTPVTVVPPPPSAGTVLDFVSSACSASWASAVSWLPSCPGADNNEYGYVLQVRNSQFENGIWEASPGLVLGPQKIYNGYTQGTYPEITVQAGDRFQGAVGCAYGFSCYVTFELNYQIGNGPVTKFWSWMEKNEGRNYRYDKDLSSLAGKNVKFILKLLATGPATNDRVLWSQPRIVRPGYVSPTPSPTPTATGTTEPSKVTGVSVSIIPLNGTFYCGGPNPVEPLGTITANGPATVVFHWEMRDANGNLMNATSDESLVFTSAGSQTNRPGAYKVDCGDYSAHLVITSPNAIEAFTNFSVWASTQTPTPTATLVATSTGTATVTPTPPTIVSGMMPIYDFSGPLTIIGTMACSDVSNYQWTPQTGNGESGGYMVSQTPLFGKSPAGFLRVDGNSICNLNLP